ncbi:substrate-binding domain-containing protein [uncultured Paludibaculum sp.]|uniref:substrate-binding domain-containing protein n=1 Tax=uncultured Paludibaculum sp. TaxID=1765020 RepID=UPI002AAA6EEF|nr:substrate-binding domain-containing protein [uncultured Paludibaculum sp.]
MSTSIRNQLGTIRRARGVSAVELARSAGVSRQTIHAIEAGSYTPNTEVTLKLARRLEVSVEELFSLAPDNPEAPAGVVSELLSAGPVAKGQAVRVCRVGDHLVSIPVQSVPYYLPEADGVISKLSRSPGRVELAVFAPEDTHHRKMTLAGCDPAIGLVAGIVEKVSGVELVSAAASSRLALTWLKEGKVHIAGSHLEDPATGEYNLPFLQREFPGTDLAVITFARWEEGFVTAQGNPLGIRSAGDLAGAAVRFVNREQGSGSRGLLDRLLAEAGVPARQVAGYDRVAFGHLAAAYAVLAGEADCCLATRSAAQTFGLDFVPLRSERYDFVMRRQTLEMPAVQSFLDVLQRAALRRKLETLAGYDTAQTGAVQA